MLKNIIIYSYLKNRQNFILIACIDEIEKVKNITSMWRQLFSNSHQLFKSILYEEKLGTEEFHTNFAKNFSFKYWSSLYLVKLDIFLLAFPQLQSQQQQNKKRTISIETEKHETIDKPKGSIKANGPFTKLQFKEQKKFLHYLLPKTYVSQKRCSTIKLLALEAIATSFVKPNTCKLQHIFQCACISQVLVEFFRSTVIPESTQTLTGPTVYKLYIK